MRKKVGAILMAIVVCLCYSAQIFAAETNIDNEYKILEDVLEQVQNNSEILGGAYVKDGVIHIIPLENTPITCSFSEEANIIYDEPQKYSLKNLNDAFMYLRENRDTLNLTGYTTNIINNNLEIYSTEWTDKKKEDITNAIGIDNIEFIEDYGVVVENNDSISDNKEGTNNAKAYTWAKYGYQLEDADVIDPETNMPLKMTLGAICDYNGKTVIVSTAHGVNKGDKIYLHDYDNDGFVQKGYLGKVLDTKMGITTGRRSIDACIILLDSSSGIIPVSEDRDGNDIIGDGAVASGVDVVIRGARNSNVPVTMTDAYSDVYWNDPTHDDEQWYENMYQMDYLTSKRTEGGDSGAPILLGSHKSDTRFSLVGIYKGRKHTSKGDVPYGSKYGFIERWFDITIK